MASVAALYADKYIQFGYDLQERCQKLSHIEGAKKLERKIIAEIRFLKSLQKRGVAIQESHVRSSNLGHYAAVLHASENIPGVVHILKPFSSPGRPEGLIVDIVAGQGHMWMKVIARKAQALHLIWAGQGQFGERDLLRQADDYLEAVQHHHHNFIIPEVHFCFYNGVTQPMATALRKREITVWGSEVAVDGSVEEKLLSVFPENSDSEDSDSEVNLIQIRDNNIFKEKESTKKTSAELLNIEQINVFDNSGDNSKAFVIYAQSLNDASLSCDSATSFQSTDKPPNPDTNMFYKKNNFDSYSEVSLTKSGKAEEESSCDDDKISILRKPEPTFLATELLSELPDYMSLTEHDEYARSIESIQQVNLDITTLITLVSNVTHGSWNWVFPEKILTLQAAEERDHPVMPDLEKFMKGKKLFACETAIKDFQTILDTLGGPQERLRASQLLTSVTVVSDNPSKRSVALKKYGRIKERSKVIFGTGDSIKAVTMTANSGFVRAAEGQNVSFAVYVHPARALTEGKEKTAVPVNDILLY